MNKNWLQGIIPKFLYNFAAKFKKKLKTGKKTELALIIPVDNNILPAYLFIQENIEKVKKIYFIKIGKETEIINKEYVNRIIELNPTIKNISKFIRIPGDIEKGINKMDSYFKMNEEFIVFLQTVEPIISIMIYNFFSNKNNTVFFRILPNNIQMVNLKPGKLTGIKYRITVKEYFTLHGFTIERKRKHIRSENGAFFLYYKTKYSKYNFANPILGKLFDTKNYPKYNEVGFHNTISDWFEDYVYYRIKKDKELGEQYIYPASKIRPVSNESSCIECDVAFMLNNELFVGECKASMSNNPSSEFCYKLAAINVNFGFNVRQIMFTLESQYKLNEKITQRMQSLNIEFLRCREDFEKKVLHFKF